MMQWTLRDTTRLENARRSVSWVQELSREHGVSVDEIIDGHDFWVVTLEAEAFEQHFFTPCELCVTTVQTIAEIEGENDGRR